MAARHYDDRALKRLGRLLIVRREELDPRYHVRKVFAAERGIHLRKAADIENGYRSDFPPLTLKDEIAPAYGVTFESVLDVLNEGGDLVAVPDSPAHRPPRGLREEPKRPALTAVPPLPQDIRNRERGDSMFPKMSPEQRPEAVARYDDYEARIILAAMEAATERGITLDAALAELPDAARVFPEAHLEQERTWWSTIQSRGLPSRPYTYQELAHRLAALRVLWDHAETGQSSAGAGLAVAAPLPTDGWIKPGIPP